MNNKNNIIVEDEIEKLFEEVLKETTILEERDEDSIERDIKHNFGRYYQHILKFIFEPSKQSGSWVNTIIDKWIYFKYMVPKDKEKRKIYKRLFENSNNKLNTIHEVYYFAINEAVAEAKLAGYNIDPKIFPPYEDAVYIGLGFDEILDKDHIKDLLIQYINWDNKMEDPRKIERIINRWKETG